MSRLSKIAIGLGVLVLLVAAAQPAHAVCSNVRTFISGYSYIQTPNYSANPYNGSSITPNFVGSFWHVGNADPALGLGNDSGEFAALGSAPTGGWVYVYAGYAALLQGSWSTGGAQSVIDGCIDAAYSGGPADRCMAVYFEDVDPVTGDSVFALLTAAADGVLNYSFDQGGTNIDLAPLPKATIANSVRSPGPPPAVTISLTSPDVAALDAGIYLSTSGACAGVGAGGTTSLIRGFKACTATAPRAQTDPPAPGDFTCVGDVAPLGSTTDTNVVCEENSNVWVSYRLVFEANTLGTSLEAKTAAGPSTRIECGPSLAEVPEQRIRARERPAQPGRQRR